MDPVDYHSVRSDQSFGDVLRDVLYYGSCSTLCPTAHTANQSGTQKQTNLSRVNDLSSIFTHKKKKNSLYSTDINKARYTILSPVIYCDITKIFVKRSNKTPDFIFNTAL